MHRIGQIEDPLATYVGVDEAMLFCCQTYIQIMEETNEPTSGTFEPALKEHAISNNGESQ